MRSRDVPRDFRGFQWREGGGSVLFRSIAGSFKGYISWVFQIVARGQARGQGICRSVPGALRGRHRRFIECQSCSKVLQLVLEAVPEFSSGVRGVPKSFRSVPGIWSFRGS